MSTKPVKLIIAGGRDFANYLLLRASVWDFLNERFIGIDQVEIILGGAPGADELGKSFADEYLLHPVIVSAQWDVQGRAAGPIRNAKMAEMATHCIVFWDGESRGTASMIRHANIRGLDLKVVMYGPESVEKP